MRIVAISDLHGHLPLQSEIPDCDLMLLGGDYNHRTKEQNWWMRDELLPWIERVAARGISVAGVAGNWDFIFEPKWKHYVPHMPWVYLEDSGVSFMGANIWGSPWQPRFHDWAFNLDEPELTQKWAMIPEATDILLLHCPPRGCGDAATRVGSVSLTQRILAVEPRLVVCGHVHSGYGVYQLGKTTVVNASLVNQKRQPVNRPVLIDMTDEAVTILGG